MTTTGSVSGTEAEAPRSRLRFADSLALGASGLRTRPLRVVLSALGIAIGIGAMVAVVGVSASSQARLDDQLAALGTNLLEAKANTGLMGEEAQLPPNTVAKVGMLDAVESVSATSVLPVDVLRSPLSDERATGGIGVHAADLDLLEVTATPLAAGRWLDRATDGFPTVVLGTEAARRLGIVSVGSQVWLGGRSFTVVGILAPSALVPDLDTSALIGERIAATAFDHDGSPTVVYQRVAESRIDEVRTLLPPTVNPEVPSEVAVSRPSDALAAKAAADDAFSGLLVGLGSVALLVGGIGVANTMIISVLERRREIGLRRALGATRSHIRRQFLVEALLLSAMGAAGGVALGAAATAILALANGWPVAIPPALLGIAAAAALAIGAAAGLYPAIRAARTPPVTALSG
ncbi:ABC transporter permease [Leifsonia shinshuensis]|uniref:Putative ABC transport system permease protein n=1 Tax=Leifsonia shinshuensis TaxID=150026 RepID=A0A853CZH0_9MICO|nr:ABC transporter permease [Leifsonia shinshuensis]NYJ25579.1 putative ABC transport system permease protein [Leifsonia shinshuensis]